MPVGVGRTAPQGGFRWNGSSPCLVPVGRALLHKGLPKGGGDGQVVLERILAFAIVVGAIFTVANVFGSPEPLAPPLEEDPPPKTAPAPAPEPARKADEEKEEKKEPKKKEKKDPRKKWRKPTRGDDDDD